MTQKARIQSKLLELAKGGRFFSMQYRPDGTPTSVDPDGTPIRPATALANETDAEFVRDFDQGRRLANRRGAWLFTLLLSFDTEVSAEYFENDVLDAVLTLPKTDTLPGVTLNLQDAKYDHPTTQDPANGSRIEYTFEAVEGRR